MQFETFMESKDDQPVQVIKATLQVLKALEYNKGDKPLVETAIKTLEKYLAKH